MPACLGNPNLFTLLKELRATLCGCKTVLDVGCGNCSPLRFLRDVELIGLEGYAPALEEARKLGSHDELVLGDVRNVGALFSARRFDACVALDLIEHLPKEDGWRLLDDLERTATRRVVILTPNGFLPQKSKDGDLQEHLSGWTPGELRQRGYKVLGIAGPKSLRGEYHLIKRRPRPFWSLVSFAAQHLYSRNHPETAAAIYCAKNLNQ